MVERDLSKVALVVALLAGAAQILATVGGGPDWGMIGNDSTNTRNQPLERDISPATVDRLAQKWVATTHGDVSATPAVVDGAVYFGDFGGMEWKLDAETGDVIWSHLVSDYTGIPGDIARTSPSVAGNTVIIGSLRRPIMLGIDATTGDLRWKTQVHPDTQAAGHGIMTGSRAARVVHRVHRRVRPEDGRTGVVVPRCGPHSLAARLRLTTAHGDVVRAGI